MAKTTSLLFLIIASLILAGCGLTVSPGSAGLSGLDESATESPLPSDAAGLAADPLPSETATAPTEVPTALPTEIPTALPTEAPTALPTEVPTAQPTEIVIPSPQPTYSKLRVEVIIEQAVCHYGPGAPYLYKYGVYSGSHLEALRRVEPGNYLEIQAIGGSNPCWVKVDYLKIENDGSLQDLQPVSAADVPLPWSPYYPPLTGVSAQREGNEVTVSWHALGLRAGDNSEQVPYIVEAWMCQQGAIVFLPVGSYKNSANISDEPGCAEPSRAWVTAAEKHGYTRRVSVPWPPAQP